MNALRVLSAGPALLLAAWSVSAASQTPAAAQPPVPAQFAWQWPLDVGGADGAVRVLLTPEVYAHITHADLSDLVAFNAADEPVPLGPAAQAFDRLALPPEPAPVAVPLFRVPRLPPDAGDTLRLRIARAADGRLTRLEADVDTEDAAPTQDLLLDLSAVDAPVTRLLPELAAEAVGSLDARVELAASSDLVAWQVQGPPLALVSLQEGEFRLQRSAFDVGAIAQPYLRLRRVDGDGALPVVAMRVVPLRRAESLSLLPPRAAVTLTGKPAADALGEFEYRSSGPLPVERIAVSLADRNAVAHVVIESRDDASARWRERARTTAFRLGSTQDMLEASPIDLTPVRDRHWRLRTEPAQPRAPTITLWFHPEQFVLLTQGPPPYRLAAGSALARRPDFPLRAVLTELRRANGDLWLPPEASLGAGVALAGAAALAPPPAPPPYRRWLLWGLLVGGALGVVTMVLRLAFTRPHD